MITKVVPGVLIAAPDAPQASREACVRIAKALRDAIRDRGVATLALSGGSSPVETYRALAAEALDWSKIHVFWVDERAVPPDSDRSNYGLVKRALLDAANVPEANVHRMVGEAEDLDAAARDYDAALREHVQEKVGGLPSIDVMVLGVGDDGHTASLFPGDPTVHVTDKLVAAVAATVGREARLTLTTPMIENARTAVILVLGRSKHAALENIWAVHGDVSRVPGRVIRGVRGAISWVIDRAAGGMGG